MWLYILCFFSREQRQSNKCKQRGLSCCYLFSFPSLYCPEVFINTHYCHCTYCSPSLSHTHTLSLFHNLFFSVKAHCQDMVISSTMPVQARSFCSNGPDGKHTVRPESAFECLPRSSLKSMWGDAPLLSLWGQGFPQKTEDGEMLQVDQMNVYRKAVNG